MSAALRRARRVLLAVFGVVVMLGVIGTVVVLVVSYRHGDIADVEENSREARGVLRELVDALGKEHVSELDDDFHPEDCSLESEPAETRFQSDGSAVIRPIGSIEDAYDTAEKILTAKGFAMERRGPQGGVGYLRFESKDIGFEVLIEGSSFEDPPGLVVTIGTDCVKVEGGLHLGP